MRYKAVLFDMDGTILDTLDDLHRTLNHALTSQGLPERTYAETRAFVGNGIYNLVVRGCPADTPSAVIDAVFSEFNAWYTDHAADHTHPYEGIGELLGRLREAGCKLAVISNKSDYAVQSLAEQYFAGMFDFALGVREGTPKKPDRAMCQLALDELGCDAADACYVGDSEVDIATATNAGLPAILCSWGFRDVDVLKEHGATTIMDSVEQLGETLLG